MEEKSQPEERGKFLREPSMEELLKKYPPSKEEIEMDYEDDEEEEDADTTFALEPWEENYYDNEGNYYPDGYYDENGDVIPRAKKRIIILSKYWK